MLNDLSYNSKANKLLLDVKDNLNQQECELIIEHVLFDKSLHEIAKEKNINFNTLKSKYLRIIKKLKSILGG